MEKKVYSDAEPGIIKGWFEHFRSFAMPSKNPDFDENYKQLVDSGVREIMDMCCGLNSDSQELVSSQQVEVAIKSLNRGKAANVYELTAEHFFMVERPLSKPLQT